MVHHSYKLLAEVFPNEKSFPDLLELESKSALIMNAGNPFFGDGLRPVMPNNLLVGMINCKPKDIKNDNKNTLLPKQLQVLGT